MTCKNCDTELTGRFCHQCGQKADTHAITFKSLIHDFIHAFTHADKGFLVLIRRLITEPGIVAKQYLEGKRKRFFNPLTFLVISAAVHFYLISASGYFEAVGPNNTMGRAPAIFQEAGRISNEYLKSLDLFLLFPLITLIAFVYFRKPKYNLAEHFVMQAFVFGQALNIRSFVFIPLFLAFPQFQGLNLLAFEIVLLTYLVIAYRQFFRQNVFKTILKTLLLMVSYIILYWLLLIAFLYVRDIVQ